MCVCVCVSVVGQGRIGGEEGMGISPCLFPRVSHAYAPDESCLCPRMSHAYAPGRVMPMPPDESCLCPG